MSTSTQTWSSGDGGWVFLDHEDPADDVTNPTRLNATQVSQVYEAFKLWEDVSGLETFRVTDDAGLANGVQELSSLPFEWTRISMGNIAGMSTLAHNVESPKNPYYHEIYLDGSKLEGAATFAVGSQAFSTLLHELGHTILDNLPGDGHIVGPPTHALMNPTGSNTWNPSTPMSWDIDQAIARFGAATTRTGDDTYGFNARFSGEYRAALDFNTNPTPLVTIYDSGGNDTLDASGFRFDTGESRDVHIDLNPGASSWLSGYYVGGGNQTFAVIYQGQTAETTTWIENAVGGEGNDEIFGNERANGLVGNGGNDILDGRGGADIMLGGAGNDTYYVNDAGDQAMDWPWDEGGLHDKVYTTLESYDLGNWEKTTGVEDLEFQDDLIDLLPGMWGREPTRHTGFGTDSNNIMTGSRGVDTLFGYGGNDTLDGGAGDDELHGGAGNDVYIVDSYGDVVSERMSVRLGVSRDAGGTDEIQTALPFYMLESDFRSRVENLIYLGRETFIGVGNWGDNLIMGSNGGDYAHGDTLFGFEGDDRLVGLDGGDTLIGGAGADKMAGGRGNDTIVMDNGTEDVGDIAVGGEGTDTVKADDSVGSTGLNLVLYAMGTTDSSVVYTPFTSIAAGIEEVIGGTGNDRVDSSRLGRDEGVTFAGHEGDDRFVSSTTYDYFDGGSDTDTAVFAGTAASYEIVHDPIGNFDAVKDRVTGNIHYLKDVELLEFSDGTLSIADALALGVPGKILTGTDAGETLTGGAGNDRIEGRGGIDYLTGGDGADQLLGGDGMDFIYVDAQDTLIDGGDGFDYVYLDSSKPYGATFNVAGTNVEYVGGTLAGDRIDASGVSYHTVLHGNYGNDVLIGGNGADGIDGSADDDTLTGGGGGDTFYVSGHWGKDTITDFTHGQDVLDMTGVAGLTGIGQLAITNTAQGASIAFGGASILLAGVAAASLNASDFRFTAAPTAPAPVPGQTQIGTAGSDTLTGGAGNDRLEGNDGTDFLTGGAGADQLLGGGGTDFLYVDADDTLIDGGDGFDYAYLDSGKAYGANFKVAGTNVEYVGGTLADDRIDATGVSGSVRLFGNYGKDVLIGGSGADLLLGSVGDDTLTGGAGRDTFYFGAAWGKDTITDFTRGEDVLDMAGVSGLTGMSQLTITDTAQGASIAFGGDSIVLQGIVAGSLAAADFHFLA